MPFIFQINGVDRTEYLKQWTAEPGGDGVVGSATFYLDQLAGGLDLRDMMPVKLWQTYNDAGAGIAQNGRIFGGHVNLRDTGNVGTTKLWTLNCWDYNIALHKVVRDAEPAKAVHLTAGTFGEQIDTLVQMIQRNGALSVNTEITTSTHNALDSFAGMPEVSYAGGRPLGWYIQELCKTVHLLDDTVFPHFYIGTETTFGALDTFGTPALHIYDGALTPSLAASFSDTAPIGGQKKVYGTVRRVTDAKAISQRRQSVWHETYYVAQDSTSQGNYPNPYINHGGTSNTGYWMNEVMEDTNSASAAEAQAAIEQVVRLEANPVDTFTGIETPERIRPGDFVGFGWSLEGIPDDTPYLVAKVSTRLEPPDRIWSVLTLNSRRIGLFPNGEQIFAPPIEGDHVPPLPPASFTLLDQDFDLHRWVTTMYFDIDPSPSPDAAGYRIVGAFNGQEGYDLDVGTNLNPIIEVEPGVLYELRAKAYDNAGNLSVGTDMLTGYTLQIGHYDVPNPSMEVIDAQFIAPKYWIPTLLNDGTVTRYRGNASAGIFSMWLFAPAVGDQARVDCEQFVALGHTEEAHLLKFNAVSDVDGMLLGCRILYWEWDEITESFVGVASPPATTFTINSTPALYTATIPADGNAGFVTIRFTVSGGGTGESVYIDDVRFARIIDIPDISQDLLDLIGGAGASDPTTLHRGGDSFGVTIPIGSNDAEDVVLETDNTERVRIDATGHVGIGVAPNSLTGVNQEFHATTSFSWGEVVNNYADTPATDEHMGISASAVGTHTTGTIDLLVGVEGYAWNSAGGDATRTMGMRAQTFVSGGSNTVEGYGLKVNAPNVQTGGTIDTAYGLYVENQDVAGVGTGWAAWFEGDVHIEGLVRSSGEPFKVVFNNDGDVALTFDGKIVTAAT